MDPLKSVQPVDPNLYALDKESSVFFKSVTGIHDDVELKEHILNVQARAYAVASYPCIRSFGFTRPKIYRMPAYKDVLKLGRERKNALLLDIGCCFGTEARRAAADGFPAKQIVASDLRRELWDLGHVLFRSDPESFPATFITGNALDPAFLSPFEGGAEPLAEVDLSRISTLNQLRGKVSAIWASSFFHLFSERHQRQVAHALGRLLSPERGSVLFGFHLGLPNKGTLADDILEKEVKLFCHDPESWKEMWVGKQPDPVAITPDPGDDVADTQARLAVFSPGDNVRADARLVPIESQGRPFSFLMWSITRM